MRSSTGRCKVEAARTGRHAEDIVAEAVGTWLEAREDEELRTGLEEARQEWERQGGVETGAFFRDLKASPTT
jgi:hypothetical protein